MHTKRSQKTAQKCAYWIYSARMRTQGRWRTEKEWSGRKNSSSFMTRNRNR